MDKRIIALNGGLGNQMFQYAFGRMLEEKTGCLIEFDTGFYSKNAKWKVGIDNLGIRQYSFSDHKWYNFIRRIIQRAPVIRWVFGVYKEYNFFCIDSKLKIFRYRFYTGYWQNIGYIKEIRDELISEFEYVKPKSKEEIELEEKISHCDSVAVHIRRGDYVEGKSTKRFVNLDEEYYKKALSIVRTMINENGDKDCYVYFFSNDISWCKEHFGDIEGAFFVDNSVSRSPEMDMHLMKCAKYLIMANSTFSWWAAWTSTRKDKVVIAPTDWYYDKKLNEKACLALLEDKWISLNYKKEN